MSVVVDEKSTNTEVSQQREKREEFFQDQNREPHALITDHQGKTSLYRIRGEAYFNYLFRSFMSETGSMPEIAYIKLLVRKAIALAEESAMRKIHLRVAGTPTQITYNLGDREGRFVVITPEKTEILGKADVLFRPQAERFAQLLPGKEAAPVARIFDFVNISNPHDRLLFLVQLICCLIPDIAHPVTILHGYQGTAKTTLARIMTMLVDPPGGDVLSFPSAKAELAQILSQNYVCIFDNLTQIKPKQSDMLCQAVTGGCFHKRRLFTDDGTVIMDFKGCLVLTGINLAAEKPDLLDRSIIFELERINESRRKDETAFWQAFEQEKPAIMQRLLVTLSAAMKIYPSVTLNSAPRMADYYRWGIAITEALGRDRAEFIAAYERNRRKMHQEIADADSLMEAISRLMRARPIWDGKISKLYNWLREQPECHDLPKAPNQLSRRIREIAENLRNGGISIEWGRNTADNTSKITMRRIVNQS